ncbi:MAG: ABC transporter substrate-binding protein [Planctomycetes bacterium]|nr:ABC transporter substrate-binding protein [Planctomycetota bacterium]
MIGARRATLVRGLPVAFVLVVLGALALTFDGGAEPARARPTVSRAGFPRDVALPDGTTLHLDAPPVAVLPAASGSVDLVAALLPPARVVALPGPALLWSVLQDDEHAWPDVPRFPRYLAEPILALRPDLVLAHDWQDAQTTARLREAGLPLVLLTDPRTWDEARAQLRLAGRLFGVEAAAERVIDETETRLATIVPPEPAPRALFFTHGGAGGWVAGAGTTNDEQARLAGVRNLAAEAGRSGHTSITLEDLITLDPGVFVVPGPSREGGLSTRAFLLAEPALATLAAVRGERIVEIDGWLYTTTSHHIVDGALQLAERLEALDR